MKQLQNNFTTPEQSKRLLELGVPADSADCFYKEPYTTANVLRNCDIFSYYCGDVDRNVDYSKYTPCWSVGRLMEIFDICYIDSRKDDKWPKTNEMSSKAKSIVDYIVYIYEIAARENGLDFSRLED